MKITENRQPYGYAGLFTIALRLVTGYTYFSAFWRRTVLADKLNPDVSGYIGVKFNHFLPNALGIKGIIEYLVTHPQLLWYKMVIFTIIEGLVGLCLMFGLFTRLSSIGVFVLAMGILLGSGWLGTTCVDEWQIGVLGLAAGATIFFSGGGRFTVDHWFIKANKKFTHAKWFSWLGSGILPVPQQKLSAIVVGVSVILLGITLGTNQYFHGGVWGTLHNKSIAPKVVLTNAQYQNNALTFTVFRTEGVDVYGSFLIGIQLQNANGNVVLQLTGEDLANFPKHQITNKYIAKVAPGKHSMIIPLGAKAAITVKHAQLQQLAKGTYTLILTDVSGAEWSTSITI